MADRMLAPRQTARHDFGKIKTFLPLPNLIDVQRRSYEDFLQMDLLPAERADVGLEAVFRGVFPFSDFPERAARGDPAPPVRVRALRRHGAGEGRPGEQGRVPDLRPPEPEQGHDR